MREKRLIGNGQSSGFTMLEVMITAFLASIAALLFYSIFSGTVKWWVEYNNRIQSVRQTHLCYLAVDNALTNSVSIASNGNGRWSLLLAKGDTARLDYTHDTLLLDGKKLAGQGGSVSGFNLQLNKDGPVTIWSCSLSVTTNRKSGTFVWRGICSHNHDGPFACNTHFASADAGTVWK